jgi:hypothetical protein
MGRNRPRRSNYRHEQTGDPLHGMVYQRIEGSPLDADHFDVPFVDGKKHSSC